jgi:hypothetical protein
MKFWLGRTPNFIRRQCRKYLQLTSATKKFREHIISDDGRNLNNCDHYSDCLVRLPLFFELGLDDINDIVNTSIESIITKEWK